MMLSEAREVDWMKINIKGLRLELRLSRLRLITWSLNRASLLYDARDIWPYSLLTSCCPGASMLWTDVIIDTFCCTRQNVSWHAVICCCSRNLHISGCRVDGATQIYMEIPKVWPRRPSAGPVWRIGFGRAIERAVYNRGSGGGTAAWKPDL